MSFTSKKCGYFTHKQNILLSLYKLFQGKICQWIIFRMLSIILVQNSSQIHTHHPFLSVILIRSDVFYSMWQQSNIDWMPQHAHWLSLLKGTVYSTYSVLIHIIQQCRLRCSLKKKFIVNLSDTWVSSVLISTFERGLISQNI